MHQASNRSTDVCDEASALVIYLVACHCCVNQIAHLFAFCLGPPTLQKCSSWKCWDDC